MGKVKQVSIKMVDLKKLREKKGLTLRELEGLTGIHFAHLNKYENDILVMNEETWEKIKSVLDNFPKDLSKEDREELINEKLR